MNTETKDDHGLSQAKAQAESIIAMVAAVECDFDRLEELRDEVKPYTAGWNMPGYMPDDEPCGCETADDAREYLADEMDREADNIDGHALQPWESAADLSRWRAQAAELREAADALRNLKTEKAGAEYGWTIGGYHYWIAFDPSPTAGLDDSDAAELRELLEAAGDCEDTEDAERRIHEDALSVEVRSDWRSVGDDDDGPTEFRILLCTGGPAVQIRGTLNRGSPDRAWLEYQDWGTPWTRYFDIESDTLLAYASRFYFGE